MSLTQLKRLRWAVRGALAVGVAASVVANVLHARHNLISEGIAAWPPLALLLTIELISRVPVHHRLLAGVRMLATTAIAGIAAWVSYWHMVSVCARYGESPTSAHLIPFSVDGVVVVASVCLVEIAGRLRVALDAATTPEAPLMPVPPPVPEPVDSDPDAGADIVTDIRRTPKRTPRRPRKPDTATAGRRLRERHPDMTTSDIARRLGVTDRTIRRHLNTPPTAVPADEPTAAA
jgi:hypothetical protein